MKNQYIFEELRKYIQHNNLDGIYLTNKVNLRYIVGIEGVERIYITLSDIYFFVGSIYLNEVKGLNYSNDISIINVSANSYKEEITKTLEGRVIGVEFNDLTVLQEQKLLNEYMVKKIVDVNNIIENIRMVKSEEEIKKIKKACEITSKAFEYIIGYIQEGQTERQICNELNRYMIDNGADGLAFDTIVASGKNSANPHAVVSNRVIQKNDIILFDFGAKYDGYCSDMSRTVFVGNPTQEMKDRYSIVLDAQKQAINRIKADVDISSIHDGIVEGFKKYSIEDKFIHTTGHGLGLDIHESPIIYSNKKEVFSENMIVTVEPGIYFNNEYGIRIEDTILVTKSGAEIFTTCNKELIII